MNVHLLVVYHWSPGTRAYWGYVWDTSLCTALPGNGELGTFMYRRPPWAQDCSEYVSIPHTSLSDTSGALGNQTHVLVDTSWVHSHWATVGTPHHPFLWSFIGTQSHPFIYVSSMPASVLQWERRNWDIDYVACQSAIFTKWPFKKKDCWLQL